MNSQPRRFADNSGLPRPRFGIRSMFVATTLICLALVVLRTAGPIAATVLVFVYLIVFAHVAGNAIGTRLRKVGEQAKASQHPQYRVRRPLRSEFAPATKLRQRASLGRMLIVATSLTGIAGAIVGGMLLFNGRSGEVSISSIAFGSMASGVLAGLFGFWIWSLLHVFIGAWWQAHRHGRKQ